MSKKNEKLLIQLDYDPDKVSGLEKLGCRDGMDTRRVVFDEKLQVTARDRNVLVLAILKSVLMSI